MRSGPQVEAKGAVPQAWLLSGRGAGLRRRTDQSTIKPANVPRNSHQATANRKPMRLGVKFPIGANGQPNGPQRSGLPTKPPQYLPVGVFTQSNMCHPTPFQWAKTPTTTATGSATRRTRCHRGSFPSHRIQVEPAFSTSPPNGGALLILCGTPACTDDCSLAVVESPQPSRRWGRYRSGRTSGPRW